MDEEWPHPRKKAREPAHWKVAVRHDEGSQEVAFARHRVFAVQECGEKLID